MANANPYKGRLGRKLRLKPGSLAEVQQILWYALKRAQAILEDAVDDDEAALKGCHAVSQISGQYLKLLEIGELEARIAVLEQAQKGSP